MCTHAHMHAQTHDRHTHTHTYTCKHTHITDDSTHSDVVSIDVVRVLNIWDWLERYACSRS